MVRAQVLDETLEGMTFTFGVLMTFVGLVFVYAIVSLVTHVRHHNKLAEQTADKSINEKIEADNEIGLRRVVVTRKKNVREPLLATRPRQRTRSSTMKTAPKRSIRINLKNKSYKLPNFNTVYELDEESCSPSNRIAKHDFGYLSPCLNGP